MRDRGGVVGGAASGPPGSGLFAYVGHLTQPRDPSLSVVCQVNHDVQQQGPSKRNKYLE